MSEKLLKIERLSIGFQKPIVNNLTLEVERGKFVTLMGENGVGKTSLIRCLLGQITPLSGDYCFWGEKSREVDRSKVNQKIAWVLSGEEKAPVSLQLSSYFNAIADLYQNWDEDLFSSLIENFKLDLAKKMGEISLGEWSKVKLTRALSIKPQMIILDELTANLSEKSKEIIVEQLISQFTDDKLGVLYISHNEEEALRISDEIFVLEKDGLVKKNGGQND